MISVRRIMGIETEYALVDHARPGPVPEQVAVDLLYAYAAQAAREGQPSTPHVPAKEGRSLAPGAGCRFDYSGELPSRDARDGRDHDLPPEARTDREAGAVLTGSPVRWIQRVDAFGQHYYRGSSTHAVTGARLYVDHTHPEYASPEALGPLAAARYDRAGDLLMHRAETALSRERGARVQIVKNTTDAHGSAWGAHESYAVDRAVSWDLLSDVMLSLLVSRSIVCGSGRLGLGAESREPGFQILARADFVEQEVSLYTTRNRPIVNTRDEPHADAGRWRRLHVITADSSCLAVSAFLRLGLTACVLSLVEQDPRRARVLADRVALADPVGAIRVFSRDMSLTASCPLAAGGEATALEIQREFLAEVLACAGDEEPDEETAAVLGLWAEALDAVEQGPGRAAHLVEWCAKLTLLERLRARYGCGWDDPRLAAADLQFAVVDPATSLAARLERAGSVRRVLTDDEVAAAVTEPPVDTRAGGRAAFLRLFPGRVWAASWTSLVVDVDAERLLRVTLPDPAHPTAAEVERACEEALRRGAGGDAYEGAHGADGILERGGAEHLIAALEALGLEVPDQPEVFDWDEGFYAEPDRTAESDDADEPTGTILSTTPAPTGDRDE
ncbi:proteasome accessory factor PafA2 family protein [Actinomyces sp. B33]|uniref:proteasome accessory factor PafA2 family protein n=1 Tax=Actinomyces sp. B33 TaxID=2942131 RepID=UPI00233F9479|nr:proteasome accessory factor PafA2 family protein [Actinomyces sp. B33]MDC4232311.1 proteasome accessory factor PafA2 family protein [Actinomyces sp. B33]